jgi:hypothetical protein
MQDRGWSTNKQCFTNHLAVAARWPPVEKLPLHGAAHGAFMAHPRHTSSSEDEMQPAYQCFSNEKRHVSADRGKHENRLFDA